MDKTQNDVKITQIAEVIRTVTHCDHILLIAAGGGVGGGVGVGVGGVGGRRRRLRYSIVALVISGYCFGLSDTELLTVHNRIDPKSFYICGW